MLRMGESQLRVGRENREQQHFRTSWVGSAVWNISQLQWACPPQFMVDPNWKMEGGSESQETHIQRQRESRVAEAIYVCDFHIPPNPSVASDALNFDGDDSRVPILPLEVVSDEITSDDDDDVKVSHTANVEETTTQRPLLHRDDVVGAAVALVALIKSKEPGSQIDLELLIQLLRNPGMLDQLMREHGLSEKSSIPVPGPALRDHNPVVTGSTPLSVSGPVVTENFPFTRSMMEHGLSVNQSLVITSEVSSVPPRPILNPGSIPLGPKVGGHNTWSPSVPFTNSMSQGVRYMIDEIDRKSVGEIKESVAMPAPTPAGSSFSKFDLGKARKLVNEFGSSDHVKSGKSAATSGNGMREPDHYRRLISQHGVTEERRPPCVYFNSPRGCRNGHSCQFQHVRVNFEGGSTKRMKLWGGNFGRHR